MCGIVAFWSKKDLISKQQFATALKTLHHRGPDSEGLWISADGKLGLGHTRLSIIDLKTGEQPLLNDDGSVRAIVNGEFYGFEKIRKDLMAKGYHFKTHSDSEILIALYLEYGSNCLEYLRGEFAFVLWDEKQQLLFAARDRFGIKPLFYTVHNETLYFASEIKALFAFGVPSAWDLQHLLSWEFMVPLQARSLFNNIHSVKPGHYLLATPNNIKSYSYWDFNYPKINEFNTASESELIKAFRHHLEEAVAIRLRADVPVGCYLSGGLDSSAVLGLMAQHQQKQIDTFTLAFENEAYNEAAIAEGMNQLTHARGHIFPVNDHMFRDNFVNAIYHCESLIFNNHVVAKFLLSKYTQQAGYKVILTGEGSDEVLGGYPIFREDMLLNDANIQDPKIREEMITNLHQSNVVSQGFFSTDGNTLALENVRAKLNYIPTHWRVSSSAGLKLRALHSDEFLQATQDYDVHNAFFETIDTNKLKDRSILSKSLYLWSKTKLPGFILMHLGDRMEMAHSLEGRLPFLDHKVVEFLSQVSDSLKIKGMTEKYLLREATKDIITQTVYERQKHPFLAPPSMLKENPFRELMKEVFNSKELKHNPIFNQEKVVKKFSEVENMPQSERQEYDKIFMKILSVCVLQQLFKVEMPTSPNLTSVMDN